VRAVSVVMAHILRDQSMQMALSENDAVVETITPNTADHPFDIRIGLSIQLHTIRTIRRNVFESPIHFILLPASSSILSLGGITGLRKRYFSMMANSG